MKIPVPSKLGRPRRGAAIAVLITLAISATGIVRGAASRYDPVAPTVGGLSPTADITSITRSGNEVRIDWNGLGGPYTLQRRSSLNSGAWESLQNPPNAQTFSVPSDDPLAVFRVSAPAPQYISADACAECHEDTHTGWSQTIHAGALNTLKAIGQDKNAACIGCHTVGQGFESGFRSEQITPQFAGVQCENCHGPAAQHVMNPEAAELRPVVTYSSKMCGGCHNGFHHPTYDEWNTAAHSIVDPHVAGYFLDPNPTNSVARMNSCGSCHSGAVRLQMLRSVKTGMLALPTGQEAAATPVTCVVCHDSHQPNTDGTHSLRNPRFSTNYFSYNTSANTTFAKQYNPNVQMCGQCHNARGAAPTDTSRPPHHSPQYNMLIGDVGFDLGYVPGRQQSPHTQIQDQCTHCHTHSHSPAVPSEEDPVYTGHAFEPTTSGCVECHASEAEAKTRIMTTQADVKARIQEVKGLLDQWGQTKAPEVLRSKYGKLAWEYTAAGQLSNPTGAATIVGPTTVEQNDVSTEIKKARLYLYLVEHDGSYGVHNGVYARYLLNTAKTNVLNLLNAP